jgi:hypothetical protein
MRGFIILMHIQMVTYHFCTEKFMDFLNNKVGAWILIPF